MASFLESLAAELPPLKAALDAESRGEWSKARESYLALVDDPRITAISLHQLGAIAERQGDLTKAAGLYQAAARLEPNRPIFQQSLGNALERLGRHAEAIDTIMSFALSIHKAGDGEQAMVLFRRVLQLDPNRHAAALNLGALLSQAGQPAAGLPHLVRGIALCGLAEPRARALLEPLLPRLLAAGLISPEVARTPAVPMARAILVELGLTNLGLTLEYLGWNQEAIACHRLALAIEPGFADAHLNLGMALLAEGDYGEGWREYEWRWRWKERSDPVRRLPCPGWSGEDLRGKTLLVYAEQGWGDAIQFAPLVARLGAAQRVLFEVALPILKLFRENFARGNVEVIPRDADYNKVATDWPLDYAVPLMSLPDRLGISLADLPLATAYLRPDVEKRAAWQQLLSGPERIKAGLVWAGRPTHKNDRNRSVALAQLKPLFAVPGIAWHSLQVGPRAAEAASSGLKLRDWSNELSDFTDTAAAIAALDLVVAVDTAVAHLAAAIGKPVIILLPTPADFRWLRRGDSNPYYPSVRLFRQPAPGDWNAVVNAVAAALTALSR